MNEATNAPQPSPDPVDVEKVNLLIYDIGTKPWTDDFIKRAVAELCQHSSALLAEVRDSRARDGQQDAEIAMLKGGIQAQEDALKRRWARIQHLETQLAAAQAENTRLRKLLEEVESIVEHNRLAGLMPATMRAIRAALKEPR